MTAYRAAWVCPVDRPPIAAGWVSVESGRIAAVGGPGDPVARDADWHDLGHVVIMPGLVNAHTHLELSWLRGRVPPADAFSRWVAQLFAVRRGIERSDDPDVLAPATAAAKEARAAGTVAVGDISNSLASVRPMLAAGLHGVIFHELIGFKERDGRLVEASGGLREAASGAGIPISVAPHAPYSVSAELFRAVRDRVNGSSLPITSVHLAESAEEVEMLAAGTGPWPQMLKWVGAWRADWTPPACGPVEYLDRLGFFNGRTLVVHGVQLDAGALRTLAARGATLVTCPRSNQWVGVGAPPIARFYQSGVDVAVGTDSLASVDDLNLFTELKTMRWLAPDVPARRLIESATIVGARALGLDAGLGTLEVGKHAHLLAVRLPGIVTDVEEYLVGGIEPSQCAWLGADGRAGEAGR